jgi:2-C-methyl-D-erythritol 2,4-cyclodiphosphate synthase
MIMTEISHIADDIGTRHWPQRDSRYFLKKDNVCGKVVSMRIGMGYDVHRLVEGRDLIIGGVKIPYEKGLLGHSDADVLLHAIMDALLGAAALGDIGKHFPDTDPAYKGISSIKLLEKVGELLEENHVFIENIDATIIAQAPKMRPHIDTMRENIAKALLIDVGQVNVKATTEEGLGFTGSGEGISSQAICLVTTPFDLTAQAMQGGCGSCSGCPKS